MENSGDRQRHGIEASLVKVLSDRFGARLLYTGMGSHGNIPGDTSAWFPSDITAGAVSADKLTSTARRVDDEMTAASVRVFKMTEGSILTSRDLTRDAVGATMQNFIAAQTDAVQFAASALWKQQTSAGTSGDARRATPSVSSAYVTLSLKSEDIRRCGYGNEWARG